MDDSFLGDLGGILKGGLNAALDLEIAERSAAINRAGEPAGGNGSYLATDNGATVPKGVPVFQIAGLPGQWVVGGALVLVLVLVVLARR